MLNIATLRITSWINGTKCPYLVSLNDAAKRSRMESTSFEFSFRGFRRSNDF